MTVDNQLRELTRQICLKSRGEVRVGGLFGGMYRYGADFETDIFKMHPFCWCDQDDCEYCGGIGTTPQLIRDVARMNYAESDRRANFEYKPTGYKVWWYKYIGRGMEEKGSPHKDWLQKCIDSVWEDGDAYYDIHPQSEVENHPHIELCFNVRDPETIVKLEMTPFATSDIVYGWTLDDFLIDAVNAVMDNEDEKLLKARELDKKYPALRKIMRNDAEKSIKAKIAWEEKRLKALD